METKIGVGTLVLLRLFLGWTFFWAFIDKVFGLGFSTTPDKAWLVGGMPVKGFLSNSHGPFSAIFKAMASSDLVAWLFMLGLLLIGLALFFGIGMRIACHAGALLMLLMWLAALPPTTNPFMDDHLIYLVVLIGLARARAGHWFGLGKWWSQTDLVKNHPILE